ncbi:MAG: DUF2804 domain-containing protein, partial [Sneathiella sp.]|nr:DUF2804 domain-containing protein [Sneathiella sp.]
MQKQFLQDGGVVPFGKFEHPVGNINYMDYPLRSPFRTPLPFKERARRFVHFHFLGFTSKRFIAGCSLTFANQQKTVFFYVFDRKTGKTLKKGCRIGDGDEGKINLDPDDGTSILSGKGLQVSFESRLDGREKILRVSIDGEPTLNLSFSEEKSAFAPLRLCTPTAANGWTYCQKVAGIKATGKLSLDGETYDLETIDATAHHDFTAGFLRRDTFWNWACVTGKDDTGKLIGLNLSNSVNETGASENALWIDGMLRPMGLFNFEYNQDDLTQDWRIQSDDGRTDLTFKSEGHYAAFNDKLECGFDFHQLFGTFRGHVHLDNGDQIIMTDLPGFCERQYAEWW